MVACVFDGLRGIWGACASLILFEMIIQVINISSKTRD